LNPDEFKAALQAKVAKLDSQVRKRVKIEENYNTYFESVYTKFDDFEKPEEAKEEQKTDEAKPKKQSPLKVVFAEKHIQKMTHILNILYSAVV
jgi:hypothetical protein